MSPSVPAERHPDLGAPVPDVVLRVGAVARNQERRLRVPDGLGECQLLLVAQRCFVEDDPAGLPLSGQ